MAAAALDEGGKKAAVAVGEFFNKVKTFALDIKAKVTWVLMRLPEVVFVRRQTNSVLSQVAEWSTLGLVNSPTATRKQSRKYCTNLYIKPGPNPNSKPHRLLKVLK